jgi:hypothetical protein
MKAKKKQNILSYLGLLVFIVAPFASYLLTPLAIKMYCSIHPSGWCGLGLATIAYGGIFFAVFLLGAMAILIATAPKKTS